MLRIIYNEYLTNRYAPHISCYWYVLLEEKSKDLREYRDRVYCKLIIKIPCLGANYVLEDPDIDIRISRNDYIIVDEPDKLPTPILRYVRRVEKITKKHKNEIFKIFNENLNRFTEEEKNIILNELLKD